MRFCPAQERSNKAIDLQEKKNNSIEHESEAVMPSRPFGNDRLALPCVYSTASFAYANWSASDYP
jgi:hypothetical protein